MEKEEKRVMAMNGNMLKSVQFIFLAFLVMVLFESCKSNHESEQHGMEHHSVQDHIEANQIDSMSYGINNLDLVDVETIKLKLEGINHEHNEEMYVQAREPDLLHYKCSECHNKPIAELQLESEAEGKLAHWDYELHHADNAVMNCFSCHNEQDLNSLKTLSGKKISFNHSYNLCGQCHSTQLKDWIGGAHGKRLGGWIKPRVSASCTNCHNPHNPSIKSRWPARLNTQKVLETQKPEIGE